MYQYRARIVRWIDADTIVVDIDLGLRQWSHGEEVRLIGINAPDKNPAKKAATAYVNQLAPVGTAVVIDTYKDEDDKYGRWLADVSVGDVNINDALLDAGHAQPYSGGTRPVDY